MNQTTEPSVTYSTLSTRQAPFIGVAGWALTTRLFELPFSLPALQLGMVWVVVCLLTTVIGFANSGEVLRKTPLAVLREMSE